MNITKFIGLSVPITMMLLLGVLSIMRGESNFNTTVGYFMVGFAFVCYAGALIGSMNVRQNETETEGNYKAIEYAEDKGAIKFNKLN